jgi:nucleoside 2-deoxyribosyltransferase
MAEGNLKLRVYLAGPLFTLAERSFNRQLVDSIRRKAPAIEFIVPQNADDDPAMKGNHDKLFRFCIGSVDEADALVCLLDGPDADSGACIEMGYAYARGKPMIGVRTDFRGSEDQGVNLMVAGVCAEIIQAPSFSVSVDSLGEAVVDALGRLKIV